jgi:hypothetical protein
MNCKNEWRPRRWLFVLLVLLISGMAEAETSIELSNKFGLAVHIDPQDGKYYVTYGGKSWLGAGIVSVLVKNRWYRSAAVIYPQLRPYDGGQGKLLLRSSRSGSASDKFGAYDFVDLNWEIPETATTLVTGFRLYHERPYLVFRQVFPDGFKDYSSGNWIVPSVAFPQFLPDVETSRKDLYSWVNGGLDTQRFAYGPASSLGGSVDVLVLSDNQYDTLVLSPFANFLVATQQSQPVATRTETDPTKAAINCGIEGLVEDIPSGFEHANILIVGNGITRTLREWGRALLDKSGKPAPSKYAGDNMKYPTYWDDYGAYYREHGFKEAGYKSYEDIILGVAKDAKKHGLRIGAYDVQDSDQLRYQEGLFEPRVDLFPHGLKWLHEKLGAPLEAYSPWLSPGGPYRKKYKFFETPKGDVLGWPSGSMGDVFYTEDYWRDTADKLASWGAISLQQDYLSTYEGDPVMMASVDRMDLYFKNQAKALQRKGITMQYCMTLPRNIMESTENPIVVSLQAGADHHVYMAEAKPVRKDEDPYAWNQMIFGSSLYGAVGLWPSRDNIQTVADPNAWEDVLIANLLGGEIQMSHRIGEADYTLIQKTYREGDGLILKPDRPIVPIDRCFHEGCAVGYTESHKGNRTWFYVINLPPSGLVPRFSISDLGVAGTWVVYDYDLNSAAVVEASTPIALRTEGKHQYLVVAPVLENGMSVVGDTEKFITMADMRVRSVTSEADALRVEVISNDAKNPIITGYSGHLPSKVKVGRDDLEEMSSLARLNAAHSGWFWEPQTKLWYVKVDFRGTKEMTSVAFSIM